MTKPRMMKILRAVVISALLMTSGIAIPVAAAGEVTVSINAPAEVLPGSDFTANIDIGSVTNFDAANYDISFNPDVLRLDDVTNGNIGGTSIPVDYWGQVPGEPPGTFGIINNVPGPNVDGSGGASGTGYLAVLHFHVLDTPGQSSNIILSNGVLGNTLAQQIPAIWVGDSVQVVGVTKTLVSIAVTPTAPTIARGLTQQFTAIGTYDDTSTANFTSSANWTSSNTTVASIGLRTGLATALAAGTTTITAVSGNISGNATLTVTAPPAISVNPTSGRVGSSITVTGSGFATNEPGITVTFDGTVVASGISANSLGAWSSTFIVPASVLGTHTVDSYGTSTPATSVPDVVFTVTPPVLVSIAVTPPNPSIGLGLSQQFTATGTYADASTANITGNVTWVSSNTAVATINSAGLATALAVGSTTILAASGGVSGNTSLTVTTAPLVSIAVTPPNPSISRGLKKQFNATGTYSDTSTANLTGVVTWNSSNPAVATINSAGLATSLAAGTTNITATLTAIAGWTTLTVTPATTVEVNNGNTLTLSAGQFVPASNSAGIPVNIQNIVTTAQGLAAYDFTLNWNPNVIKIGKFVLSTDAQVNRGFNVTPGIVDNVTGSFHIVGTTTGGDTGYLKDNLTLGYLSVTAVGGMGANTTLAVTITNLTDNMFNEITPRIAVNAPVMIGVNLAAETGITQGLSSNVTGVVVIKTHINRIKNLSDNSTVNITGGIGSYSATIGGTPGNAIKFVTVYGVPPFNGPTFDNITGVFGVPYVAASIQPNNTTVAEVVPILIGSATTTVSLTVSFQVIGAAGQPGLNVPEVQPNTITLKRGDADKNGAISVVDSLAIKQYLVGQLALSQISPLNAGSPNHDGASGDKISVVDALAVEQYLVGQINSYFQ